MPLVTSTEMFKKAYEGGDASGSIEVSIYVPTMVFRA